MRVLSAALESALARTDVRNRLMQLGIEPQTRSREELKAFAEAEKKKWAHLIKAAGLKPDKQCWPQHASTLEATAREHLIKSTDGRSER